MGAVNGFLVTVVGMQPFIATLGMLSVVGGAMRWPTARGFTLYPPQSFDSSGKGTILGIPNPVVVMIGLAIVLTLFLRYTPLGRHIYAVGGNEDAARLLGIRVKGVKFFTYAMAGLLGCRGGVLLMSFLGSANPSQGVGDELNVDGRRGDRGGQPVRRPGQPHRDGAGSCPGRGDRGRAHTGLRCRAIGPNSWSGA